VDPATGQLWRGRLAGRLRDRYPTKEFSRDQAVFIGRGDDAGKMLTPAEARRLTQELLLVASLIEGKV
jgi:hypothetical protein